MFLIRAMSSLRFSILSLLCVVTFVCLVAFMIQRPAHPKEVNTLLSKVPAVVYSEGYRKALIVLFEGKVPKSNYIASDFNNVDNKCRLFDIAVGYRLVFFLKNGLEVEHLSVDAWDTKSKRWTSVSESMTDSSLPIWLSAPENVWIKEGGQINGVRNKDSIDTKLRF